MLTSRPVSSIWHGSVEYLEMKLNEMVKDNVLVFWCAVKHLKEDDEKKDHVHLFCVPNGRIRTEYLHDELTEYDMNNVKPIKPLPFNCSKFDDWYLYCTHNIAYLASKGQSRKYHYAKNEFLTSDEDYLNEMIHTIDMSKINRTEVLSRAVENGIPFTELVTTGQIPVPLVNQYMKVYEMMAGNITFRADKKGHEEGQADEEDELPF